MYADLVEFNIYSFELKKVLNLTVALDRALQFHSIDLPKKIKQSSAYLTKMLFSSNLALDH